MVLRPLLFAASLACCIVARADESHGWVDPEPMGPRGRVMADAICRAGDSGAAKLMLGEALRLPAGQAVAVIEDVLRRGGEVPRRAVLGMLPGEATMPVSRGMADAVLALHADIPEPELPEWSSAVRRFDAQEVRDYLRAHLADPRLSTSRRLACLAAIGDGPEALTILMAAYDGQLVPADDPLDSAVRLSAGTRLADLLFLSTTPTPEQLQALCQAAGRGDAAAVRAVLHQRARMALAHSEGALALEVARIRDLESQVFQHAQTPQRSAQIARLLGEEDVSLCLLAMDLLDRELQTHGPEVATDPVRIALRRTLAGAGPELRARASQTLWVLDDAPGATLAADRLTRRAETSLPARIGLARLVSRAPTSGVVPSLIALLDEPTAREVAVDALRAASDRKLLVAADAARLAERLKQLLAEQQDPRSLLLLGRILSETDGAGWTQIEAAIGHSSPLVREAAALAVEHATRPLEPLLAVLAVEKPEPKLMAIAYRAFGDRGNTFSQAQILLAHPPAAEDLLHGWQDALSGWASRAAAADVKLALADPAIGPALCERMASQTLGRANLQRFERADLIRLRAKARKTQGDFAGRIRDLDELYRLVEPDDRGAVLADLVTAKLDAKKPGDAATAYRDALSGGLEPKACPEAKKILLERFDELAAANDKDGALAIARVLLPLPMMDDEDRKRLNKVAVGETAP